MDPVVITANQGNTHKFMSGITGQVARMVQPGVDTKITDFSFQKDENGNLLVDEKGDPIMTPRITGLQLFTE